MTVTALKSGASDAFLDSLRTASWFSSVGLPATPAETADARLLTAGLKYIELEIKWLQDWPAAEDAARNGEADWWQKEDAIRTALLDRAGPSAAPTLDKVMRVASDATIGAAAVAATRAGIADPYLTRVAAGAASQAAYQAALADAAGESADHPFAAKYRLFAAGRWPLGLAGGKLCIF